MHCQLPDEVSLQEIAEKIEFLTAIDDWCRSHACARRARGHPSLKPVQNCAWPFIACHSPGLCYNARSSSTPMFPQEASERLCAGGCRSRRPVRFTRSDLRPLNFPELGSSSAFTLLELLIVVGIIAILFVLIVPAFTTIKSGTDITSAAYTIKGVLDTARTYAKANNTYTWVGFYEEDVTQSSTNPATPGTGRVVLSIVASKDGTTVYNPSNPGSIDPTRLIQVGKLVKIDNFHLPIFNPGLSTGDTFDTRPWPSPTPTPANDSRFGEINLSGTQSAPTSNTQFPFQYPVGSPAPQAQYPFQKTLQFNPRGESTINSGFGVGGTTYAVKSIVEIGLIQTHGNVVPTPTPTAGNYVGNVAAIQISGFGGNVRIYRR
jgi:type II secretory pathway pseudopilin PulG